MRPPNIMRFPRAPELVADLAKGAAAGLVAALVTSLFQRAWCRLQMPPAAATSTAPPTETLAAEVYQGMTGKLLHGPSKVVAGEVVHYAMGAALGASYALIVRRWPMAAAGRGGGYGLGVWATVEEGGLALFRLKPPPWRVQIAEHVFAASSHLVFGLTLERCSIFAPSLLPKGRSLRRAS